MRNPYFFVFLGMLSCLLATFELKAQTTKLIPPFVAGNPVPLFEIERPRLPSSPAAGSSTRQRKVSVDLSTVPDLGSAQTEAGLAAPGFAPPGFTPQMPTYTPPSYTRAGGPAASESPMNVGIQSVAGVMNLFQMALQVGQRINPRASGPLFLGECTDCAETSRSTEVVANTPEQRSFEEQVQASHNPEAIKAAIAAETAFQPYEGLEDSMRELYIDATIRPLNELGAFLLHNASEFQEMCPNYQNLNINQKKAVAVFVMSEIFKQTSNYNTRQITPVTIAGRQTNRVGLCQIEYQEVAAIFESHNESYDVDENTFANGRYHAATLNYNLGMCFALLTFSRVDNPSASYRALRARFPNVDFNTVNTRIGSLNMCQTN